MRLVLQARPFAGLGISASMKDSMKKTLAINPLNPIVHFWSHCALRRKDSLCALVRWFCVSRKGGTGGGGTGGRWVASPVGCCGC